MQNNKNYPLVSLILPNYNNEEVIDEFFKHLFENTTYPNYELIVVDDGSTDTGLEIIKKWKIRGFCDEFKIIKNDHFGICTTLNKGLSIARGKYICRLDGDAFIKTKGWLEKYVDFMESSVDCGMLVPKILFPDGTFHSAGTMVFDKNKTGIIERDHQKKDAGQYDKIEETDTGLGCCTIFPKFLSDKIGGIDEDYNPCWVEDWDFGMGVRKEGYKVFYFPLVVIVHFASGFRKPRFEGMKGMDSFSRFLRKIKIFNSIQFLYRITIKKISFLNKKSFFEQMLEKHFSHWEKKWGFHPNDRYDKKEKFKKKFGLGS